VVHRPLAPMPLRRVVAENARKRSALCSSITSENNYRANQTAQFNGSRRKSQTQKRGSVLLFDPRGDVVNNVGRDVARAGVVCLARGACAFEEEMVEFRVALKGDVRALI